jgi:hypothetical protein
MDATNLQNTQTDLMVDYLANNDKLVSENKRWYFDKSKDHDLDDDFSNYMGAKPENKKEDYNVSDNREAARYGAGSEKFSEGPQTNVFAKKSGEDDEENLTQEELMLRKLDMLRKLCELAQAGVKLSQNYNMNSDYKTMKYEYELHKNIRSKQNSINWMSSMCLNAIYGIEMLNEKYNPFDIKLKGWSEQMNADVNNYYDVFGDLYEKYNKPGKGMAPELKLLLMISGSALKFHLTNTMLGNLPTLNQQLDRDPVLAEQLRQKAIAEKIKEQNQKQAEALNIKMSKEHEGATQKVADINMIKQKEMEYLNLQKQNAQKEAEFESLKRNLAMGTSTQSGGAQPTMSMPSIVKNMMMPDQLGQRLNPQQVLPNGLNIDGFNPMVLEAQKASLLRQQMEAEYVNELEKLKTIRKEEEKKKLKTNKTPIASESSDSDKLEKMLKKATSKTITELLEETSEKVEDLGNVNEDEISNSISLGNKSDKSKKSRMSMGKKGLKTKKTGISIN